MDGEGENEGPDQLLALVGLVLLEVVIDEGCQRNVMHVATVSEAEYLDH